jgi:hypothetical protein
MLKKSTNHDAQIIELRRKYNAIIQLLQEFQEQLDAVEAEVRIVATSQADRIAELECLASPYSQDGTPICNLP